MRKVMVSKRKSTKDEQSGIYKQVIESVGVATFHGFGVDYEEFENGAGNYSTAIIEWPDGQVESVEVCLIRFIGYA